MPDRHHDHGEDPVRVVIAEDQALLREGLARLFHDGGHTVVSTVGDAEQLIGLIAHLGSAEHLPDLVVVDIRMPPTHTTEGLEAARILKERHPGIGVLVLSQHIETAYTVDLVANTGFGYLLKDRVLGVADFLSAAQRVADGGSVLDPKVVARLVAPVGDGPLHLLSEREREVLALMAEGLTNSAIAQRLVVSDRTVEAHIRHLLTKLGIPDTGDVHRRVLAVLMHLHAAVPEERRPGPRT
jgi:DNA-binding NarL/FixJ family response regulator